jgi:hypothetical protein
MHLKLLHARVSDRTMRLGYCTAIAETTQEEQSRK